MLVMGGLGGVAVVEVIALLSQAARPLPTVDVPLIQPAPEPRAAAADPLQEMPSIAESLGRPLFASPIDYAPNPASQNSRAALSDAAKQLAGRLTLMGIVAGDPAQAIIQDSQGGKTYFVTVGQPLAEGAVLERVLENRVVLSIGSEQIELSL